MLQNKLHVLAARFTLASIWFDQEPGFDLTKCAFVVSLLVFKRDNLPKSLARTAKECNKVTFGWCSSIVNSLGDKRLSAVSEQTRSKTARIFFFFGSRSILRAAKTENLVPHRSAPWFFFVPKKSAACLLLVRVIRTTGGIFYMSGSRNMQTVKSTTTTPSRTQMVTRAQRGLVFYEKLWQTFDTLKRQCTRTSKREREHQGLTYT